MLTQNFRQVDWRDQLLVTSGSRLSHRLILMTLVMIMLLSGCVTGSTAGGALGEAAAYN